MIGLKELPNYSKVAVEAWEDIPGFSSYQVSNMGRVRSLTRTKRYVRKNGTVYRRSIQGRIISTGNLNGYRNLTLVSDRGQKTPMLLHRLVLKTFVGGCPDGMQGCHNNGDRSDNRLENLRWDTITNNHSDKIKHGTALLGSRNHQAKLTAEKARKIRVSNQSIPELMKSYNMSRGAIRAIKEGRTWVQA